MRPIDADVLLSQLEGILSDYTSRGLYPNGFTIESTIDAVVDMPTIITPIREKVERLRGEWEQCLEDWGKQIEGDKCSRCGFEHYGTSIKNITSAPAAAHP